MKIAALASLISATIAVVQGHWGFALVMFGGACAFMDLSKGE